MIDMQKKIFLFFVLLIIGSLNGITIIVDINGTGDYTSIQSGINAGNDGDIVLVYPGRYYENIDYLGKTITVASLEMTTGNRDYIHSTIIDGNQTDCCVAVHNGEGIGTILRGFTITNGIGYLITTRRYGGGIFASYSNLKIINSIIKNNSSRYGGGIANIGSIVYLEGNTIKNNFASEFGGGVACGHLSGSVDFSYGNR
jgi:hypothetical protein